MLDYTFVVSAVSTTKGSRLCGAAAVRGSRDTHAHTIIVGWVTQCGQRQGYPDPALKERKRAGSGHETTTGPVSRSRTPSF